jgi:hypothetical protein
VTVTTTATTTARAASAGALATTSTAAPATNAPKPSASGTTVGNWQVQGKLTPKDDGLGDFGMTFRVLNTSSTEDTGIFTVDVLKGNTIWTSMTCTTSKVAPGQIGTTDCIGGDKFRTGWTDVTPFK